MKRDNRFRIGLVVVLILASIWSLVPTVRMVTMDEEERLRMQVENPAAWKNAAARVEDDTPPDGAIDNYLEWVDGQDALD